MYGFHKLCLTLHEAVWKCCLHCQLWVICLALMLCMGFINLSFCSVQHSGGQRVRLDLSKLNQFSIFPGQVWKKMNYHVCWFMLEVLVRIGYKPKRIEFLQVVGIEGHNPSGHCLIASKILDSIPVSAPTDVDLHPAKKQARDEEFQSADSSHKLAELSLVCMLLSNWIKCRLRI